MRARRGFTLVELLIVIVMLAIVSASVGRILVGSLRVSRAQVVQADMQANVRTGGLVLPLELREIGYDSNVTTAAVTSDIETIGATEIQFRAMRGIGYTCGVPTQIQIQIRRPTQGARQPLQTDGFLLYVENVPSTATDDQWVPLLVTVLDDAALCGADPAITLTFPIPEVSPGVNLALTQIFVGGPVRYYERMEFGLYADLDGKSYLGARSVSLGEPAYRAVAGPLNPGDGVGLTYYDRNGVLLDPGVADPADVRTVDLILRGLTAEAVDLAGSSPRRTGAMTTRTQVALRNTLSH